jgi:hypothetical protein
MKRRETGGNRRAARVSSAACASALLALLVCVAADCQKHYHGTPPDTSGQVTISQGVWGNVWFWEGNFMPVDPTGTITPVRREVYAYELTKDTQVEPSDSGPLFRVIHTRCIDSTRSNSTGFFQMELAPGRYSFFAREGSRFFADLTDTARNLFPATVVRDSVTKVQIDIDYLSYM